MKEQKTQTQRHEDLRNSKQVKQQVTQLSQSLTSADKKLEFPCEFTASGSGKGGGGGAATIEN